MKAQNYQEYHGMIKYILIFILILFPSLAAAGNISLLVSESDSYAINKALKGLDLPSGVQIQYHTSKDLEANESIQEEIAKAQVIVVDVMIPELTRYLLKDVEISDKSVYALRGSQNDEKLKEKGFIFDSEIQAYYKNISVPNIQNMIYRIVHEEFNSSISYQKVQRRPKVGIYHPQAEQIFTDFSEYRSWYEQEHKTSSKRPWLGMMFYSSSLIAGQRNCMDKLIQKVEQADWNVAACFGKDEKILTSLFLRREQACQVDAVLAFSLKFYSAVNDQVKGALSQMNVPVFNAINLYGQTISQWREDPVGIPPTQVVWTMANPEMSAVIEPTPLSGQVKVRDPDTGREVTKCQVIESNLELLLPRLAKWRKLAIMSNKDKQVAIIYYNHGQGKQNIGASYLNVFRSLELILQRMQKQGYQVAQDELLSEEKLKELLLKYGRNIGSWAPGELEEMISDGTVLRLPVSKYKKWFSRLPQKFKDNVLKQWGPVEESSIMIRGGDLIIPGVRMGKVMLLPEPARGWSDEPMKLYHDPTLYPHHQYIAAYLWLKYGFEADAMIHLGTHATYEWLPGKQVGLSPSCPPEIMLTDIPNLYPYIVDDVGEGIQAKRRGRGVIIDHLIPPMRQGDLYKEYSRLYNLINSYNRSQAMDNQTIEAKLEKIRKLSKELDLDNDLGLQKIDEKSLEEIEHYLLEIKGNLMPYGLHTFGRSPQGEAMQEMVTAISETNPESQKRVIQKRLNKSGSREIDQLMHGLEGKYIPAGEGNDPLRNPEAIPTGKNFYGFDPEKVPSSEAWEMGKEAAREIINSSLEKNGTYPKKVAVVLWATETIRNEGVNESTILALLGLKPTWDNAGRVTGSRVIPAKKLARPRIDVLINPSGLYRDLFPSKIKFLDQAVQKAVQQKNIRNFLREHSAQLKTRLLDQGYGGKKAEKLSKIRIFSEETGSYGTGVSEMTDASGVWESDKEIAEVYENRAGYAFGQGLWGRPAKKLFKQNLAGVDAAVHSRSSNVYGTMDNDDMFQYLGGLSLAVRKESGQVPDTLITQQQISGQVKVEDAAKTIGRELRTRYLNPEWIQGMKKEDYAGAREMANFVNYMWGWQVTTPEALDEAKWEQTYDVYVRDKYGQDLKEFFNQANPWAYQSITARMLETLRKGYWQPEDQVKKNLAVEYAKSVIEKGVACCDHSCDNPLLNKMVTKTISLPGVMSSDKVKKFQKVLEKATGIKLQKQVKNREELQKKLSQRLKQSTATKNEEQAKVKAEKNPGQEKKVGTKSKEVKGYQMEEIDKRDKRSTLSSLSMQWLAFLFVLLIIGVFILGIRFKRRF